MECFIYVHTLPVFSPRNESRSTSRFDVRIRGHQVRSSSVSYRHSCLLNFLILKLHELQLNELHLQMFLFEQMQYNVYT